jgi:hypothetical protein
MVGLRFCEAQIVVGWRNCQDFIECAKTFLFCPAVDPLFHAPPVLGLEPMFAATLTDATGVC